MQSDKSTCPHCKAVADASPDAELRFRCNVCGAPRVPVVGDTKRSGKEIPALQRAETARRARAFWRGTSIASGIGLVFFWIVFGLIALVFGSGTFAFLAALMTVPLGAFFVWSLLGSAARGKEIEPALDAAWLSVATEIAHQHEGPLTAASLAKEMGIEESVAEELLALLSVNDVVQSDVTDAGDIAYSSRFRVPNETEEAARIEADVAAEHEAEAEADSAARSESARKAT